MRPTDPEHMRPAEAVFETHAVFEDSEDIKCLFRARDLTAFDPGNFGDTVGGFQRGNQAFSA